MHVPIGRSGVHAVPNTLHSHGLMTPFSTSPPRQAFGSATRTPGTLLLSSASQSAYASDSFSPLCEMKPMPRHASSSVPFDPLELLLVVRAHLLEQLARRERFVLVDPGEAIGL